MDNRVYWIWLQQALKYGNNKIRTVNLIYENAEDFYNAGEFEWKMCGCFSEKEIKNMVSYKFEKAEIILDKCVELGYDVITIQDPRYPERLKHIFNPPCVLYVKGDFPPIDNKICISVVGTRSATLYGVQMSFDISFELAKAGVIIVSGGALGVDSAAHKGAIQGRGKTVAVLGCGLNYPYLLQNAELRNVISQNGALVSEFPPDYPGYSANFPMRNRIISGLSLGTVVIEAGRRSGSLITAAMALEQNRDVFAVPVDMNSSVSEGTTALIRDGAKIVVCAEDVLSEYRTEYFREKDFDGLADLPKLFDRPDKESYAEEIGSDILSKDSSEKDYKKETNLKGLFEKSCEKELDLKKTIEESYEKGDRLKSFTETNVGNNKYKSDRTIFKEIKSEKKNTEVSNYDIILSDEEQLVYNLLKTGNYHIDKIALKTNLPIRKLLSIITNLEIKDIIQAFAGKIYGIKK